MCVCVGGGGGGGGGVEGLGRGREWNPNYSKFLGFYMANYFKKFIHDQDKLILIR